MSELTLTRILKNRTNGNIQSVIRIDEEAYSLIMEVAEETGMPLKVAASTLIKHAYHDIKYKALEGDS